MIKSQFIAATIAALLFPLAFTACNQHGSLVNHKLVVTGNEHSVPMYPDEQTYLKVARMNQEGGIEGMAGKVNKDLQSKNIDDQTEVKVVSSDDNGSVVQIVAGPMKGQTGFVAKQNVD